MQKEIIAHKKLIETKFSHDQDPWLLAWLAKIIRLIYEDNPREMSTAEVSRRRALVGNLPNAIAICRTPLQSAECHLPKICSIIVHMRLTLLE